MTEFRDQDLAGARVERVRLTGATFTQVGPDWDGISWNREARPSLDEVLAVRCDRQATVRHVLASLTDERPPPRRPAPSRDGPGRRASGQGVSPHRPERGMEHRLYAERDLTALEAAPQAAPEKGN